MKFIVVAFKNGIFRVFAINSYEGEKTNKKSKDFYHKCEQFFPSAIGISEKGKKIVIGRAIDQ